MDLRDDGKRDAFGRDRADVDADRAAQSDVELLRRRAQLLADEAFTLLRPLENRGERLADLLRLVLQRDR